MFSLNAPIPGRVARLADDLAPALSAFDAIRERHALVLKRLPDDADGRAHLEAEVRRVLAGAPPAEATVTGIDAFFEPVWGPGPVVYLAVESPGLRRLHDRLVEAFGAVAEVEGGEYVPHVTLARDGPREDAERLRDRPVDPVTWTVGELRLWDARDREVVGRVSLRGS